MIIYLHEILIVSVAFPYSTTISPSLSHAPTWADSGGMGSSLNLEDRMLYAMVEKPFQYAAALVFTVNTSFGNWWHSPVQTVLIYLTLITALVARYL